MLKRNKLPVFRIDEPLFATKDDKEYYERETKQIKHRGFAGSEIFALDYALACFLLPRLDAFRKNKESYPASLALKERILCTMGLCSTHVGLTVQSTVTEEAYT